MNRSAIDLIESLRTRPGLYWDAGEHPLTSLRTFLTGYRAGYWAGKDGGAGPDDLVPFGFHEFVAGELGVTEPLGGRDWSELLREGTQSGGEAVELFFDLRQRYEERRRFER